MKNISFLVLLFLFFESCTKSIIPEELVDTEPIEESITYTSHIQAIVLNNCISCHSLPSPNAGLLLETYNQVKDATQNGNLIERINDPVSPMPSSGLMPAQERALFDAWTENDYLEN